MHGRFQLFEIFSANDEIYLKVAEPLLSIGTVGSMTVERKIKTNKYIDKGPQQSPGRERCCAFPGVKEPAAHHESKTYSWQEHYQLIMSQH